MQFATLDEAWNVPLSNEFKSLQNHTERKYEELIDSSSNHAPNTSITQPSQNKNSTKLQIKDNEVIPPWANESTKSLPDISYYNPVNTPPINHTNRVRNRRPKFIYESDSDDEPVVVKKKITCDDIESHINKCTKCYNKYNKHVFDKKDFPDILNVNNADLRQTVTLALAGVGLILLLDYLFRHQSKQSS